MAGSAIGDRKWPAVLWLGMRPFYLLAGLFAVIAMPAWIAFYSGFEQPAGYLRGIDWHNHEMVFGFAVAVIAGFLLTAVRNWTGLPTSIGGALAGLAAVWILARVLVLSGPGWLAALTDLAFLPLLGLAIALPIWRSRNRRNVKLLFVVLALWLANGVYHLAQLQLVDARYSRTAITAALDIITVLMAIVGGRVIPAFTASAIKGATPKNVVGVEIVALGSLVAIAVAGLVSAGWSVPAWIWLALLVTAGVAHGLRLALWQPWCTRRSPLLLMLPVAYLWIPVSLLMRAMSHIAAAPPVLAVHALTIGAISSLMMAMMTRSALGHSGRPLVAGPVEIGAFVLIQFAALVRVGGAMAWPAMYRETVTVSGLLWALGFLVFLGRYGAILTRPRIDGKPG